MRTPRPTSRPKGIATLIGYGEAPSVLQAMPPAGAIGFQKVPREWDVRGRSALRKCMFLPVPPHLRDLAPPSSPLLVPPQNLGKKNTPIPDPRRAPEKFARVFPAIPLESMALYEAEKAKLVGRRERERYVPVAAAPRAQAWYEDPVALGALLLVIPPIGLAALWSSKRYSNDARWALTVMTGLTMCLAAAMVLALVVLR